jgi:serine/threonine protein phosphatase 1
MGARTFAIGDIHGNLEALNLLLERIAPEKDDTIVFLGDYLDRGTRSKETVERVRTFVDDAPCKAVALRGNHEDIWIECFKEPNAGFLLPRSNGCMDSFRSFTGAAPLEEGQPLRAEEFVQYLQVGSWFPKDVIDWFESLPLWYEDEHALFVHAGLDGRDAEWKHPKYGRQKPLMWMREKSFYNGYDGKRVVFGHTHTRDLPQEHRRYPDETPKEPDRVWLRGELVGLDTGCGRAGVLSAIELPTLRIIDSR